MVSIPHQCQAMDITYGRRGVPGGGSAVAGRGKGRSSAEGSPISPHSWESSMMQLAKELRVICRSPEQGSGFQRSSLSSPSPASSPYPSPSPSPPTPGPFSSGPFMASLPPLPELQPHGQGQARAMPIQHQTTQERLREKLSQICRSPRQTLAKPSNTLNLARPSKRKLSGFRNLFRAQVTIGTLHVEDLQVSIEGRKLWVKKNPSNVEKTQKLRSTTDMIEEENCETSSNSNPNRNDIINANDPCSTDDKENKPEVSSCADKTEPVTGCMTGANANCLQPNSDSDNTLSQVSSPVVKDTESVCEVTVTDVQEEAMPRLQVPCCVSLPENVDPERLMCVVRDGILEIKEGRRRSMPSPTQSTYTPPSPRALDPTLFQTLRPMVIEDDGSERLKLVLQVPPGYCFQDLQIKMVDDHLIVASKPSRGTLSRSISLETGKVAGHLGSGRTGFAQVFELPDSVDPYSLTAHLTDTNQLIIQATLSQRGRCYTF